MHYVYILKDTRNKYYIGYTSDLKRRITEHTKKKPGYVLVYYEAYESSSTARDREQKLKQYGSAWSGLKRRIEAT